MLIIYSPEYKKKASIQREKTRGRVKTPSSVRHTTFLPVAWPHTAHRYGLALFTSFSREFVSDPDELLYHVLLPNAQAGTLLHQFA